MFDNSNSITLSIFFIAFLAVFVGVVVGIFFQNRAVAKGQNRKSTIFVQTVVTFILTTLIATLVFWISVRIPRKTLGTDIRNSLTQSPGIYPTSTLEDS